MTKKNHKKPMEKPIMKYHELLYMTPVIVTAKEIASLLMDHKGIKLELWEEMNILEIELPSLNTVDIEPVEVNFLNSSDAAFVKNRGIRTIFAVTLKEDDLLSVKDCFHTIIERFSGFLCTDSEDFKPIHVGSVTVSRHTNES